MIDEVRTVVMNGSPRERGTPEDDAARNDPEGDRYWRDVGPADLRVQPVEVRQWPFPLSRRMRRGGFKGR